MRINDSYHVERDARNWVLVKTWTTEGKKNTKNEGKMMERRYEQFFGSLDGLCRKCIDDHLDPGGGFDQMLAQLVSVRAELSVLIKKQGLQSRQIIREAIEK